MVYLAIASRGDWGNTGWICGKPRANPRQWGRVSEQWGLSYKNIQDH